MHASLRRLASLAALVTLTAGTLSFTAQPLQAGEEVTVQMNLLGFSPSELEVETGTTVTWVNTERMDYPVLGGAHQLRADDGSFNSGEIPPGAAFTRTFNNPVTISYVCSLHPHTMTGSLKVVGDPVVPPATEKTVQILEGSPNDTQSWRFAPKDLRVDVGTTVIWRNLGSIDHTVTVDGGFDSGFLRGGQSYTQTFTKPIAISYYCKPHPWMTGTLVVSKPGEAAPTIPVKDPVRGGGSDAPVIAPAPPVREGNEPATWQAQIVEGSVSDPQSWGYAPESLSVQAGDTVVWTNAGSIGHTVTAADGLFDSGDVAAGATFGFTFPNVGTFTFACTPHPWMTGVVQVVPVGVDAGAVAPPAPPAPAIEAPGSGATGGSESGTDISTSEAAAAWTVGHLGLAAGTGIGIFAIGAVIALLGALQLRRQGRMTAAQNQRSIELRAELADTDARVIDLTETPVLVGAEVGAIEATATASSQVISLAETPMSEAMPMAAAKPVVARKPAVKTAAKTSAAKKTAPAAAKPAAKKPAAKKPAAKKPAATTARKPAAKKPATGTAKRGTRTSAAGSRVR